MIVSICFKHLSKQSLSLLFLGNQHPLLSPGTWFTRSYHIFRVLLYGCRKVLKDELNSDFHKAFGLVASCYTDLCKIISVCEKYLFRSKEDESCRNQSLHIYLVASFMPSGSISFPGSVVRLSHCYPHCPSVVVNYLGL